MQNSVDYAGLFPPAALPMTQVVENYARYRDCPKSAMLNRLIIPALKLSSFAEIAKQLLPTTTEEAAWKISALIPQIEDHNGKLDQANFDSAFKAIYEFNQQHNNDGLVSAVVDAVEIKTPTGTVLESTLVSLTQDERFKGIRAFLEIPHASDPNNLIGMIADKAIGATIFAKIRTGGIKPELIPPASEVARFILACAKHEVGFKATAGLHHPIRAKHKLTYEPDSESATTHGFLNVFVAAAIAFEQNVDAETLEKILTSTRSEDFSFEKDKLVWNDFSVPLASISDTRNQGLISFGSCSFVEPTEELVRLPGITKASIFSA